MDDHDIVAIHHHLTTEQMTLLEVIAQWLHDDHQTGRFRIFYFINRIFQTQFLGINFPLWAAYTGLQAVLTTFFFFVFARLINFSILEAVLFALLTTVGAQSAIWWMLGPAETIGTFLLSICLVLVALSATSSRWQRIHLGVAVLSALLMSLSKESYILMLPAIALLIVWLHKRRIGTWSKAIQSTAFSCIILLFLFLGELLFVKYFVGTTPEIGYAGFNGFHLSAVWQASRSLGMNGDWWIILISLFPLLIQSYQENSLKLGHSTSWKSLYQTFSSLVILLILFALIVIPQAILYAKSGISQRYLFPGIVAYSLLNIWLYRDTNQRSKNLSQFILLLIGISLSFKLHAVWGTARIFALEGKATNQLLTTIAANTTPTESILIVTNPLVYYEWNYSIKKYLNYVSDRTNLYVASFEQVDTNDFGKKLRTFYNGQTIEKVKEKNQIQCIVVFPSLNKAFLRNSLNWFNRQQYQEFVFKGFNRNLNPNSQMSLYCRKNN